VVGDTPHQNCLPNTSGFSVNEVGRTSGYLD
jgi:hypothetical protein